MKKKLLALAVAGAFVAPAAMADTANVNIYGVMHGSVDFVSTGSAGATSSQSQTKVSSNQSRFGFKGTEDLGGGTNAFFQLENGINIDNSTAAGAASAGSLNNRNTFVGIGGESWGSVLLGNNDSPYKSSTRGMDLFADTIGDNRSLMGGGVASGNATATRSSSIQFDGRNGNVLQYDSPNFSGFKASLQYIAGAENANTAVLSATKGTAYSLAGTYAQGPMNLALAYETHDMGTAGNGSLGAANNGVVNQKERAYKLAGSYTMDQITGVLVYEKTDDGFGAAGANLMGHRSWYLGGKFAISGSDAVKLAYTNSNNLGNVANTGAKQISLGYDHAMSKRTTVYAMYSKLTNDSAVNYQLGGAIAGGASVTTANDQDPSAFSIGLKHAF